jgi:hypothetical protein
MTPKPEERNDRFDTAERSPVRQLKEKKKEANADRTLIIDMNKRGVYIIQITQAQPSHSDGRCIVLGVSMVSCS